MIEKDMLPVFAVKFSAICLTPEYANCADGIKNLIENNFHVLVNEVKKERQKGSVVLVISRNSVYYPKDIKEIVGKFHEIIDNHYKEKEQKIEIDLDDSEVLVATLSVVDNEGLLLKEKNKKMS